MLPLGALVNGAMKRPVMDAAERHREFVAGLAAERTWLHEPKVVRVARLAAKERRHVCRATNRINVRGCGSGEVLRSVSISSSLRSSGCGCTLMSNA